MLTYRFMFWRSGSLCSHKVYQFLVHNPLILCLCKGHVHIHNLHNVGATLRLQLGPSARFLKKSKGQQRCLDFGVLGCIPKRWRWSETAQLQEPSRHPMKSSFSVEYPVRACDGGSIRDYDHHAGWRVSAIINCQLHSIVRCRGRISHYFTHHWDPCNL